ncbi:helix-turn-helix transcriptional regulator [Streptomyces sp. NPDC096153]|uniref:helix-turn-helix domain-containing protein n=1 Tax=Streptomyces sp. NPDC096153 TaxID=3155548 RepID=UPI00332D355B
MNRDPQAWARLGKALYQSRQAQGLTQEHVAEQAGVSVASVQNAEAGKVPKSRMPQTIPAIARALGFAAGAADQILAGEDPDAGWRDVSVQPAIDAEQMESIITNAMVRATESVTAAEIKKATKIALDELRRHGLL